MKSVKNIMKSVKNIMKSIKNIMQSIKNIMKSVQQGGIGKLFFVFLLLGNEMASGDMLDKMYRFVSFDEQIALDDIAKNTGYESSFERLQAEGRSSTLFFRKDTCNILCWALRQNKLNEDDFMDYYHFLLLNLLFIPDAQSGFIFPDKPPLAVSVNVIPYSALDPFVKDTFREKNARYLDGLGAEGEGVEFYEYSISDVFKLMLDSNDSLVLARKQLADNKQDTDWAENLVDLKRWFGFLGRIGIIALNEAKDRAYIPSFSALAGMLSKREVEEGGAISIKPGFGSGKWEDLKAMRMGNEHPLALWHPAVDSIIKPDGLWIGTLAHLHDLYHVAVLNGLTKAQRQLALDIDTLVNTSYNEFLMRLLDKKGSVVSKNSIINEEDRVFIEGVESLYGGCYPWKERYVQERVKDELEGNLKDYRPFIDQDTRNWDEFKKHRIEHCLSFYTIGFLSVFPDPCFRWNKIIFDLVRRNEDDSITRNLLCADSWFNGGEDNSPIREYPEIRDKQNPYRAGFGLGVLLGDKYIAIKWHIDWWVRYLSGKEALPESPASGVEADFKGAEGAVSGKRKGIFSHSIHSMVLRSPKRRAF